MQPSKLRISKYKIKNNFITYDFKKNSKKTYAEIFGVNAEDYADTIITYNYDEHDLAGELSVRARNALKRTEYNTLKKLLILTPSGLRRIQNIGAKSVDEIENWLEGILEHIKAGQNEVDARRHILQIIKWRLQGYENSITELTSRERVIFAKAMKAAELFGNNFCLQLMTKEMCPYIETITGMFNDFSAWRIMERAVHDANKAISKCRPELLSKSIRPYLRLFCSSKGKDSSRELESIFDEKMTVQQYGEVIAEAIGSGKYKIPSLVKKLQEFQNWLSCIDLESIYRDTFTQERQLRMDVLSARADGDTLEKIAKQHNLTKERIRQIERKSLDVIKRRLSSKVNNLFLYISAYHNGISRLSREDIEEVIGVKYANILWFCATMTKNHGDTYFLDSQIAHYDAAYCAIMIHNDASGNHVVNSIDISKIKKAIDGLPELIETVSLQNELVTIAKRRNLPLELLERVATEQYKEAGRYSHKGWRLTKAQMCNLVLKERFQNGYKIADTASGKLFQKYLIDFFGAAGHLSERAIDREVPEIGILIDHGKYIHQDYIHIDKKIVRKIFDYVEASPKTVITDSEIFLALKKVFQGTVITNPYALHGVIRLYNKKYILYRNTISKNSEKKVDDEFIEFMRLNGIIHKSEIIKEFGWQDYNLSIILARCPEIIGIGNGYFMHISKLDIDENIINDIRQYLDNAVKDMPVSIIYLNDYFMANFTDFMVNNEINDQNKLFSILQHMFAEEYRFSRPYISKKDTVGITTDKLTDTSVLLTYLKGIDAIEITDLIYICGKSGIKIHSTNYIIDILIPEFIRVNDHTLMRFKNIGFLEEMYQNVAKLVSQAIKANNGYISVRNINDFGWYPIINIPWTQFLLENIAKLIPSINMIKIPTSSYKRPQAIFVSDKYANEDWKSFLVKLLKAEHDIEPFITKMDIFEWLKKEGLCGTKYPAYLENENHVFYDDNGKLRIE